MSDNKVSDNKAFWDKIEAVVEDLLQYHRSQLLKSGRRIIPHLTQDDLLQPNDYLELELDPHFRYDEGVLAGIQTLQMALQALKTHLTHRE